MSAKRLAYPVVAVFWNDAHLIDDDFDKGAIRHKPEEQVITGFLIRSDKIGITLAVEYGQSDPTALRTTYFIPRGIVKRVLKLSTSRR